MAKKTPQAKIDNSSKNKGKTNLKSKEKNDKPSFGSRVKSFFKNLKIEIKKVIWPDKNTLRKTTMVVIVIVLCATLLVWLVDSVMTFVLGKLGFNTARVDETPNNSVTISDTTIPAESNDSNTDSKENKITTSDTSKSSKQ